MPTQISPSLQRKLKYNRLKKAEIIPDGNFDLISSLYRGIRTDVS